MLLIPVDLSGSAKYSTFEFPIQNQLPVYSHASFITGDKLYVYGGLTADDALSAALFEFNFELRKWTQIFVSGSVNGIYKHGCIIIDDSCNENTINETMQKISSGKKTNKKLDCLSPVNNSKIAKNQTGISKTNKNIKVFVFGGINESDCASNQIYTLEPNDNSWALKLIYTKGRRPSPRHSFGMCYVSKIDSVAVFGGIFQDKNIKGQSLLTDLFLFGISAGVWTQIQLGEKSEAIQRSTLAEMPNGNLLVFGGKGFNKYPNDFTKFNFCSQYQLSKKDTSLFLG